MSQEINLEIKGLVKKFEAMPETIKKAMMEELILTAIMIESTYKIGVPVDTGRLITSIHTEYIGQTNYSYSDNEGNSYYGSFKSKPKEGQVIIGSNVEYANKIEYLGGKTKGKEALLEAFKKETRNLPDRLAKLIK